MYWSLKWQNSSKNVINRKNKIHLTFRCSVLCHAKFNPSWSNKSLENAKPRNYIYIFSRYVSQIKLITLSFRVHVKLFCRIVSYRIIYSELKSHLKWLRKDRMMTIDNDDVIIISQRMSQQTLSVLEALSAEDQLSAFAGGLFDSKRPG